MGQTPARVDKEVPDFGYAAPPAAPSTETVKTFHRKALPEPSIEFSSLEGQRIFAEAFAAGTVGGF